MKEGSCSAWLNGAVFTEDESGALFGCCESSAGGSQNSVVSFISAQLQYSKADHFVKQAVVPVTLLCLPRTCTQNPDV